MFPRRRWRSMWRGRIFGCLHPQLQIEQIRSSTVKMRQHRSWKEGRGQTIETSTWLVVPLIQEELTRIVADDDYMMWKDIDLYHLLVREAWSIWCEDRISISESAQQKIWRGVAFYYSYVGCTRSLRHCLPPNQCHVSRMPRVSASSRVICHLHLSLPPNPKSIHLPPGESMPRVSSSTRAIPIMMWWSSISYA